VFSTVPLDSCAEVSKSQEANYKDDPPTRAQAFASANSDHTSCTYREVETCASKKAVLQLLPKSTQSLS
jgi:hypothetical protein